MTKKQASLTNKNTKSTYKKLQSGLFASYDIRPGNGVGPFWLNEKEWKNKNG